MAWNWETTMDFGTWSGKLAYEVIGKINWWELDKKIGRLG